MEIRAVATLALILSIAESRAELVSIQPNRSQAVAASFRLEQAGDIPHSTEIVPYDTHLGFDMARMMGQVSFEFRFGKLSAEEVAKLNLAYSGSASFDPEREYELKDFLPASMRTVLGKRYRDKRIETNCWSAAYEVQRGGPTFAFFYVDPERILPVFRAFSTPVTQPEFGDLLLITYGGNLHHAAIYVDRDLFFEKTGLSRKTAFRLAHRADIEFAFTPRAFSYEFRRITGSLPHPQEAFGLRAEELEELMLPEPRG